MVEVATLTGIRVSLRTTDVQEALLYSETLATEDRKQLQADAFSHLTHVSAVTAKGPALFNI